MDLKSENFKRIYLDYYSALCYFASKIVGDAGEAEDIVEDFFVKFLQSERVFTEEDNVRAYLYTSIKNASLSHLTQSSRAKSRQGQYQAGLPESEPAYINDMIRAEVIRSVIQAIKKLPEHEAQIIELSYIQGMKNAQIAELLGLSEQTVKNLKSKGLHMLKAKLTPGLFMLFMLLHS
jgi:RNA polymerase sigma-70 factor (ECF subfamily)